MEHAGKNTAKTTNYTLSLRMLVIANLSQRLWPALS